MEGLLQTGSAIALHETIVAGPASPTGPNRPLAILFDRDHDEAREPQPKAGPMSPLEQLEHVNRTAEAVVAKVTDADLDKPTPCGTWVVRTELNKLIASVIHTSRSVAEGVDDERMDLGDPPELIGDDPLAALQSAHRDCEAAFGAEGAFDQEDLPVAVPGMRFPAPIVLAVRLFDTTVVTWDIARAIGVDHGIDAETAAAVKGMAEQIIPAVSGAPDRQRFQDAFTVDDDAPMIDQMIATTGRDPSWQGA